MRWGRRGWRGRRTRGPGGFGSTGDGWQRGWDAGATGALRQAGTEKIREPRLGTSPPGLSSYAGRTWFALGSTSRASGRTLIPLPFPRGPRVRRPEACGASTETSDLSAVQPGSKTRLAAIATASRPLACFPDLLEDDHRHRFRRPHQGRENHYSISQIEGQASCSAGGGNFRIRRKATYPKHLQRRSPIPRIPPSRPVNILILFEESILSNHSRDPDFKKNAPTGILPLTPGESG